MFETIQQSEGTAARRRIRFSLIDSADHFSPKDITVTGVKVRLSLNDGASANSTNDIVKFDGTNMPGEFYIELTVAEAAAVGSVSGYLKPTGCDACAIQATIVAYDPYADGASGATIADALLARNQKGGSNAAPTVAAALAAGLLSFTIVGALLTVRHGDGTVAFTRTLTREALDALVGSV